MTKNNSPHDTALRQVMQHRAEAAERMTLTDDFTDRLMERIGQQERRPRRRHPWLVAAIGAAAAIALLFYIGAHISSQDGDTPGLVAQIDTTKVIAPQTETKKPSLQKMESTVPADSAKKVKEMLQMSRPPRHYMAKRETKTETVAEPEPIAEPDFAQQAIAEEERRVALEMMLQANGSPQDIYQQMSREIRERGNRMTQQVETALSDDTY